MTRKQDALLQELKDFEKKATEERKNARELREDAVGLLTPSLLRKNVRSGTNLVLAYGRNGMTVEFTIDDLKRFVAANEAAQKAYRQEVRGVPLAQLEKNSDPKDVERSKEVRTATLYKISKNLLHFSVTGNSKPHYLVRVRLEDWNLALHSTANPLISARMAATGRISFDCACGRHQYWYRYLTNIGGFDVNPPKEQDFPKIRNPGLKGCCCKHVLKVLRVLKSNTVHAVLAKELERQGSTIGFGDTVKAHFLKVDELRQAARARGVSRNPREATQAERRFQREARQFVEDAKKKQNVRELQKKLKPRNKSGKKTTGNALSPAKRKAVIESLRNLAVAVKLKIPGFTLKSGLENIGTKYSLSVTELKGIMKEENIQ